ncbi:TIGR04283 family arsenosugar biosynthesis glycosyltransferase [Flavobacterium sp. SM2513]|uniref:TIGR04283 family arsenosugar biosynthesis glycosyltransferase n=1 Tax=Flavobacterium sp. SM2513 TaxID=3424766 RepID=UPI003D7F2455
MIKVSVIVPVFNEALHVSKLLSHLRKVAHSPEEVEIIVVDGGSTDGTLNVLSAFPMIHVVGSEKGRAKQMNTGAQTAQGRILYFLHCDTLPPLHFDQLLVEAVHKGHLAGCFRMKFDYWHPVLLVSQWFTRFNHISCRGGDQSLFVSKALFKEIKGFDERFRIYEDNEIISRLYVQKQFVVLPATVVTSARKYLQNGVWRLQYHFSIIHLKRRLGHSTESMLAYYRKKIQ